MVIKLFNVVVRHWVESRAIEIIGFCHGCLVGSMWNNKCRFRV